MTGRSNRRLRYELRLGTRILATGRLMDRLQRLWSREEVNSLPFDLRGTLRQGVDELAASAVVGHRLYVLTQGLRLYALDGRETADGGRYVCTWARSLSSPEVRRRRWKHIFVRSSHLLPRADGGVTVVQGNATFCRDPRRLRGGSGRRPPFPAGLPVAERGDRPGRVLRRGGASRAGRALRGRRDGDGHSAQPPPARAGMVLRHPRLLRPRTDRRGGQRPNARPHPPPFSAASTREAASSP